MAYLATQHTLCIVLGETWQKFCPRDQFMLTAGGAVPHLGWAWEEDISSQKSAEVTSSEECRWARCGKGTPGRGNSILEAER